MKLQLEKTIEGIQKLLQGFTKKERESLGLGNAIEEVKEQFSKEAKEKIEKKVEE